MSAAVWGLATLRLGCNLVFVAPRSGTASTAATRAQLRGELRWLRTAANRGGVDGSLVSRSAEEQPPLAPGALVGKVALVTGASRGIGAAIAERLVLAGATVVGTATSERGAEAIAARFGGDRKGTGMKLDVVDPDAVATVMKAIEKQYGTPDILINNAGITKDGLMMRMKDKEWDDVINTNLNSIFRISRAALKGMSKKRWGRIVSISSVVGSMGNVGQANYAAAKAGLDGFSRALAKEVGSRAITVNTVAPGFIGTDMTDKLTDEWKAKLMEQVPTARLGTPDEVADAVLFLASPQASYITGQTLHVNGGMYM